MSHQDTELPVTRSISVKFTDIAATLVGLVPFLSWFREDKQFALIMTFVSVIALLLYLLGRANGHRIQNLEHSNKILERKVQECESGRDTDDSRYEARVLEINQRHEARITVMVATVMNMYADILAFAGERAVGAFEIDESLGVYRYKRAESVPPNGIENRRQGRPPRANRKSRK